jgi:hypothetical protein
MDKQSGLLVTFVNYGGKKVCIIEPKGTTLSTGGHVFVAALLKFSDMLG